MFKKLSLGLATLSLSVILLAMVILPTPTLAQDSGQPTSTPVLTEPYVIINTYALNVRTGPDVRFATKGAVRFNQTFEVVGLDESRQWFYVRNTPFGDGWVRGKFTIFRGNILTVPTIPSPYEGALAPNVIFLHIPQPVFDVPNGNQVGLLAGRLEYEIIGRTEAANWLLLRTEKGNFWIQESRGSLRGNLLLVPVAYPPYSDTVTSEGTTYIYP